MRQKFYVIDSGSQMTILGVDFFMKTGAVIDFSRRVVAFRKWKRAKAVPFRIRNPAAAAASPAVVIHGARSPIYLAHDIQLQPGQVAHTACQLGTDDPLKGVRPLG